jgi:DNA polymerase-3 subunit delta'
MKALDSENKQGMIFVEESAEILRKLSLKPYESDWKVMIIWLPERMHPAAANKLLKILEEPPDQTLFLLISENTQTILPTFLSRVQMIRVPRLPDSDIEKALTEKYAVDQTRAAGLLFRPEETLPVPFPSSAFQPKTSSLIGL